MKIALISCGRSDFSIYLPLIKSMNLDPFFDLDLIAFGTHNSQFYGNTIDMFTDEGLDVAYKVESLVLGDSPESISTAMGLTTVKFSSIWAAENYEMIIVLGDRYEMFSAIVASIPFGTPIAHLYGGDTTLGAFDDIFRHSLSLMSQLHFVSTPSSARRVEEIIGTKEGIHHVGVISLEKLDQVETYSIERFKDKWNIDLDIPTVLVTFHPETRAVDSNLSFVKELCSALKQLDKQIVITMPNNDTLGSVVRNELLNLINSDPNKYKGVEVLGEVGYYTCMKHCEYVLGNSSSGITEAASFGKYVINLGDRQKGRVYNNNVFHIPIVASEIVKAALNIEKLQPYGGENVYFKKNTVQMIMDVIKEYHNKSA